MFTTVVLLLSGCGFQLRGNYSFPFKRLALIGLGIELSTKIQRMVESGSQTRIVRGVDSADAILSISEERSAIAVSRNVDGHVDQYKLNYTMSYQLLNSDGAVLLPPSTLHLNRLMSYSDQYILAKSQECDLLYRDMSSDALRQLLWRIGTVYKTNLSNDGVRVRTTHALPR
ncbi:LPS assembly lipoprotein LptE [Candidatus Vallotia tarda]|uniref:LPS-assembly lipoprotein LptE n=1 Tax=Candidatus Vallotiella hemipterorum TaxID=1177213 RepID=UPI001FE31F15|nr:LPS assembly lipoprotein LptE [Candidatus Vallotia tarda]